jgi:Protein of unknown function (DUF4245)
MMRQVPAAGFPSLWGTMVVVSDTPGPISPSEPATGEPVSGQPASGQPASGEPGELDEGLAPRRRGMGSSADMLRSMLVIVAVVGVLLLIVPRPNKVPTRSLDVAAAASAAQAQVGLVPSVPKGLPEGWTAVAADVQQATDDTPTWHLSYLTPDGTYAGVQEAAHPSAAWEARQVTDGGTNQGEHQAAGHTWIVRSRTDRGITSWVLRTPERTTIVTGTASEAELDQFAESLLR